MEFLPFPKIPRLRREIVITEKIDGTNALIHIVNEPYPVYDPDIIAIIPEGDSFLVMRAGSRTRWITPNNDNFGFAAWVHANAGELSKLGEGAHYGEWYGRGIQRGYGMEDRKFALFNPYRYIDRPYFPMLNGQVHTVPLLYVGTQQELVDIMVWRLNNQGSTAVPGFMKPEGIVVYHTAAKQNFKVLCENDEVPKGSIDFSEVVAAA